MTSSGRNSRSRGRILSLEGGAECLAAVAGAQRRVDDGVVLAALADRAGAGKQRHLVRRAIHHRFVGPENLLRAVAVMHVEIDDRGAGDAVLLLRIARGDGGIVEQAKAHRPRGLGVMAGRARGDEGVCRLLRQHLVDREDGAADRAQRRLERAGRHRGVGVEPHHALFGRGVAQLDDVVHRMAQRDGLDGAIGACSRASCWNFSASSACSTARSRSGRSGWPAGVRCSRQAGWLIRSVDIGQM